MCIKIFCKSLPHCYSVLSLNVTADDVAGHGHEGHHDPQRDAAIRQHVPDAGQCPRQVRPTGSRHADTWQTRDGYRFHVEQREETAVVAVTWRGFKIIFIRVIRTESVHLAGGQISRGQVQTKENSCWSLQLRSMAHQ